MAVTALTDDQRDCLQEICNVAMGRAGDVLAQEYGVFVTLSIPSIRLIRSGELATSLQNFDSDTGIYASSQLFSAGDALGGLALVVLAEESVEDLSNLLHTSVGDAQEILFGDTCQKLTRSCLEALAEQWGAHFSSTDPVVSGFEAMSEVCRTVTADWRQMLLIEINYRIEQRAFNGDLLLLFPDEAIEALVVRLDTLLGD